MAKNSVRDYSATNSSNSDIQSIDISEGCSPANINNAIREVMVDLKNVSTGAIALETPSADRLDVDNIRIDGNTISSTDTNGDITLDPNGTGDTIIASGNLGVGTTSPDHTLTVSASSSPVIEIEQTSGGPYKTNIVLSGNDTEFRGSSGNIEFYTGNDDGASSTERMRIDSSGTLLVGTTDSSPFNNTSTVGTSISGGELQLASVNGEAAYFNRSGSNGRVINIRRAGTFVGGIDVSTTQVTYNQTSDYRLKENVSYTWDATARLKQLKPARFNYIVDADNTVDGFLAHEVESIVPQAISGAKDAVDADGNIEPQCIDHSKLVPLLCKTILELEARITALEAG